MGIKLLDYVKKHRKLTNYGLAKELRTLGIEVTTQGIDGYDNARSMRFDVLVGLVKLSGLGWEKSGKMLEEEIEK